MTHTLSMTERQRVMLALVASAFIHLVVITLFIVSTWWKPPIPRLTLPVPKPLEVTLMNRAMPTPTPVVVKVVKAFPLAKATPPPEKVIRSVLSSDGLTPSQTAPKNPAFESDVNSRAASEQPGKGRGPLPSQEGKERPFMQFETKAYSTGASPKPAAQPQATPLGYSKVQPSSTPAPEARFQPTPIPGRPLSTPVPTVAPARNAFPLARSTPKPSPAATPMPTPLDSLPRPTPLASATSQQLARLNLQSRPSQPANGYRPETEKTKIEGGVSNKGRASVDAVGTPLGRYRKAVADAIGSRWYYYTKRRMDLIDVGEVHIRFYVNRSGRVESLRILANSANESLENICVQSVNEAQIPPIPPDVIPKLEGGRLEIEYQFNIYPQ
jgi:TonB family protein